MVILQTPWGTSIGDVQVEVEINGNSYSFLIDTGSEITILSRKIYEENKECLGKINIDSPQCLGAGGQILQVAGTCFTKLKIGDKTIPHTCVILEDSIMKEIDGILGADFIKENNIILWLTGRTMWFEDEPHNLIPFKNSEKSFNFPLNVVIIAKDDIIIPKNKEVIGWGTSKKDNAISKFDFDEVQTVNKVSIAHAIVEELTNEVPLRILNQTNEEIKINKGEVVAICTIALQNKVGDSQHTPFERLDETFKDINLNHLKGDQKEKLIKILKQFGETIQIKGCSLGHCAVTMHHIYTTSDHPLYQAPYRVPFHQKEAFNTEIKEMEKQGVIEPSNSPWSAPIVQVKKADGLIRICIDYRKLNAITKTDPYPLPNIQETLDQLGSAKYFTALDLASGYWQIDMDTEDREKTAFTIPGEGRFEFTRMPFGLKNAPATFQRTMEIVLRGLIGKICFVYLDDVIIIGSSFENHLENLETVLGRLRAVGLKIKLSKCQFVRKEVKYLGHIVSSDGIKPNPEKVEAIKNFPRPSNIRTVRGFLGLVGYYR